MGKLVEVKKALPKHALAMMNPEDLDSSEFFVDIQEMNEEISSSKFKPNKKISPVHENLQPTEPPQANHSFSGSSPEDLPEAFSNTIQPPFQPMLSPPYFYPDFNGLNFKINNTFYLPLDQSIIPTAEIFNFLQLKGGHKIYN
jgi:hypothetical protein